MLVGDLLKSYTFNRALFPWLRLVLLYGSMDIHLRLIVLIFLKQLLERKEGDILAVIEYLAPTLLGTINVQPPVVVGHVYVLVDHFFATPITFYNTLCTSALLDLLKRSRPTICDAGLDILSKFQSSTFKQEVIQIIIAEVSTSFAFVCSNLCTHSHIILTI